MPAAPSQNLADANIVLHGWQPLKVMLLQLKRAKERQQVAVCQVRQVLIKIALDLDEVVQRVIIVQVELLLQCGLRLSHCFPHQVQRLFQALHQSCADQMAEG